MTPNIYIAVSYSTSIMNDLTWKLASLGQLALLLEASAPKPGNVNRSATFSDMDYRHFLASASMMSRGLYLAANRGCLIAAEQLAPENAKLGELIEICVSDSLNGVNNRNTILGSILLYMPLTAAIAASLTLEQHFSVDDISKWLETIIGATSVEDTLGLYRAFAHSAPSGQNIKHDTYWSDIHRRYDFDNPDAIKNITHDCLRLEDLFRISAEIDEISKEWSIHFHSVLYEIHPFIQKISHTLDDLEEAIVPTFVWLLSKRPDGLIIKKAGRERAEEVRMIAYEAFNNWSESNKPEERIAALDEVLRREGNLLNPGTTADLVSATVFCRLVSMSYQ
jgi:triphosphoribosyl-dephospho-CoA synthase